ncbi:pseudouridine synthase [Shouchella shacheensis]|uniref:pseudouridine synthase n=1 Tax=Shouchella shacheensis TaxID=1649580 RepID=UPI00073FB7BD|nr:pseudouridine synthase [Shouchella shacheensis]
MRVDKLLASTSEASRKDVKQWLKQGFVTVDGVVVKEGKRHVDPSAQVVELRGQHINYQKFVYLMLNKPKGVVSATEDNLHQTVIDLVKDNWGHKQLFPVGRLDKDTEGLLLLTNDGSYSHRLMAPKKHVPKRYAAVIEGRVTDEDVARFKEGVVLEDGYVTKPGHLEIVSQGETSFVYVIISEGKFHQVKRMFATVDKRVVQLKRESIGDLQLDAALGSGEYRELSEEERAASLNEQTSP